ncbi:prohormone-3 isoform X1 [Tribolium madens]|uniref:prohormone-3 isoform X1 n=1 Tax=Tribolium madens TaxID=41895 RepID=UPI001CF74F4A|nr:prohormone-3 isoform X1 [Tribolium madens]
MRALIILFTACLLGHKTHAWGGLFNRFSPEMLANMGYGGHGGFIQRTGDDDKGILEEYTNEGEEEPCYGKPCTANEHCCPGSVCVDVDGVVGSCLFAYGRRVGELCRRDSDCESGLVCAEAEPGVSTRVCRPPVHQDKQYSEPCNMSSECDISRGLCCQLQRRHRQAPRKVCSYFKDPLVCIGPVASDQIKSNIQHTAGEKRLTGLAGFKRPMH